MHTKYFSNFLTNIFGYASGNYLFNTRLPA